MDKKTKYVIITILGIILLVFVGIKVKKLVDEYKWMIEEKESYNEISFTEPDGFTKEEGRYETSPNYSYRDDDVSCYLSIGSYDKSDTKEKWFKRIIYVDLNDVVSEQETLTINGKSVLSINVKEDNSTTYYYGFESTNHYYVYRYTINDYTKGDRPSDDDSPCFVAKDQVLSSIKVK